MTVSLLDRNLEHRFLKFLRGEIEKNISLGLEIERMFCYKLQYTEYSDLSRGGIC